MSLNEVLCACFAAALCGFVVGIVWGRWMGPKECTNNQIAKEHWRVVAGDNADSYREEKRRSKFLGGQIEIAVGVLRKQLPPAK